VAAWALLIFSFSTDRFSSEHSAGIIVLMLRWLLPHASLTTLDLLHEIIRKSAHFAEYFVFGLLLLRAIRGCKKRWRLQWALAAVAIAAANAGLDEFHQSFVSSRNASIWDALLDTAGATAAQGAMWLAILGRRRTEARRGEGTEQSLSREASE
jgi:VanZ family protein